MKRIIAILIILLLLPMVFAQGQMVEQSQVKGLENAQLKVMNQEQQQLIEQVMEKIQEQHRIRLNQVSNLEFKFDNNNVIAEGLEEKKFLNVFKVKRKVSFEISSTGNVTERIRFTDLLFTQGGNNEI